MCGFVTRHSTRRSYGPAERTGTSRSRKSRSPPARASSRLLDPVSASDQGVLVRPDLPSLPRSLSDLRRLKLCAERATTGALLVLNRVKPDAKAAHRSESVTAVVRPVHEALRRRRLRRTGARGPPPASARPVRAARRPDRHEREVRGRAREREPAPAGDQRRAEHTHQGRHDRSSSASAGSAQTRRTCRCSARSTLSR